MDPKADPTEPRFNEAFHDYATSRGFLIDACRVRTPTDKPRVERVVHFVRGSYWAGETFTDVEDAQRRAVEWCRGRAGMRIHGTIQCRPLELFTVEEQPLLLPAPAEVYDVPRYAEPKVPSHWRATLLVELEGLLAFARGMAVNVGDAFSSIHVDFSGFSHTHHRPDWTCEGYGEKPVAARTWRDPPTLGRDRP